MLLRRTNEGVYVHILNVRATELLQAFEADIFLNNYQVFVALFKCVISMKDFRITIQLDLEL